MKWWPWRRNHRLERARRERDEVTRRTGRIDAKVARLEKQADGNQFAARFRIALGGDR